MSDAEIVIYAKENVNFDDFDIQIQSDEQIPEAMCANCQDCPFYDDCEVFLM